MKGEAAEQLVLDLLKLCDNVEIIKSQRCSALDEVLKVDIVARSGNEFNDVFAFQVKCSEYGANEHFSKYGDEIKYKDHYFRTPWCFIVKDIYTPGVILDLLLEELCLPCSIDFCMIESIATQVVSSNGERVLKTKFPYLKDKDYRALRLLHNIGSNKHTLFYRH